MMLIKFRIYLKKNIQAQIDYTERENFRAYYGVFNINRIKIEIMGNPEIKLKTGEWIGLQKENITNIKFNNKTINVFTLESEYKYYNNSASKKQRNRKIAEKIKHKFL